MVGSGWWRVRVDVNAMLGVGGDVGYGGCEPRIEGIVQCTKRYCTILRKKMWGGEGEGQYLNPKHYVFKKEKRKKNDRAEIRTHDLRVRNPLG